MFGPVKHRDRFLAAGPLPFAGSLLISVYAGIEIARGAYAVVAALLAFVTLPFGLLSLRAMTRPLVKTDPRTRDRDLSRRRAGRIRAILCTWASLLLLIALLVHQLTSHATLHTWLTTALLTPVIGAWTGYVTYRLGKSRPLGTSAG